MNQIAFLSIGKFVTAKGMAPIAEARTTIGDPRPVQAEKISKARDRPIVEHPRHGPPALNSRGPDSARHFIVLDHSLGILCVRGIDVGEFRIRANVLEAI